jgi:hypothetical protein
MPTETKKKSDTKMASQYNRPEGPLFGGFNPAMPGDTLAKPVFTAPTIPAAQDAGYQAGKQAFGPSSTFTFTQSPSAAVSETFKSSIAEKGPTESSGTPGMMAFDPIPPPLSSSDIASAFQPLFSEIQSQVAPPHQVAPPPTPAMATFLSVLAGSLGAQLTKNPAVQDSIMRTLAENEQRRKAIEDQNYANDAVFNQQKASQRLAATGKVIEAELDSAIKANDMDRVMKAQQNLEKLKGYLDIQNTQARETSEFNQAVKVEQMKTDAQDAKDAKGLDPKDYISRRGDLIKSKLPERGGVMGKISEAITGPKMTKAMEVARVDKEGLSSGNPNTVKIAQRNILQDAMKLAGVDMATIDKKGFEKLKAKLKEVWDITPEELGLEMSE